MLLNIDREGQNEKQKFFSGKWGVHNESNDN